MAKNRLRLGAAMRRLNVHDHLCLIYKTRDEQFAAVVPFIQIGLERGEKCVYIADENSAADVLAAMRQAGVDVDGTVKSGALTVAGKQDSYLRQGYFDPDLMIEFLRESTKAAKSAGYSALRVTGEMTWMLGGDPGAERLIEYESKLNRFIPDNDCLAICQYNREKFSSETILDVIRTHPLVIYEDLVCANYSYIPTEEFLAETEPEKEVARTLANMVALQEGREEAERWQDVVRSLPLVIVTLAPDHKIIDLNDEAERLYKCRRDQAVGHDYLWVFIPEAAHSAVADNIEKVLAGASTRAFENAVVPANGPQRLLRWHVTRMTFSNGTPAGVVVVGEDITESKRAEKEVRDAKKLLEKTFASLDEVVLVVDPATRLIKSCNPAAERVFGYGAKELIGRTTEFLHADRDAFVEFGQKMLPALEKQGVFRTEWSLRRKSGEVFPTENTVTEIREDGQRVGVVSAVRDITERKQSEQALRESEANFRAVAEAAGAAIFIIQGTRFIYHNRTAEKLTGYTLPEIGRLEFTDIIHPDFVDMVRARAAARLRGEKVPDRYEVKIVTKRGEERWLDYTGAVIKFGGQPAILGTALDITEKKHGQEAEKRRELDIRQAYIDVLSAVTGGKLIIATPDEITAALGRPIGEEIAVLTSEDISEAKEAAQETVRQGLPGMENFGLMVATVEALANAVTHGGGGRLRLYRGDGDKIQIVIEDSGPGIDFSLLPKATLGPNFSTKQSLGLGFGIMLEECDRVLLATEPGRTVVVLEKSRRARKEKYGRGVA